MSHCCYQMINCTFPNYFVIKKDSGFFISLNLEKGKQEIQNRLRDLNLGSLRFSKQSIIISCIEYLDILRN